MKIFGRNPTPDKYSIKDITIGHEKTRCTLADGTEKWLVDLYLLVDLEPEYYQRDRFAFGMSYEKKKNPCTVRIELSELQDMQKAVSEKLEESYQFLHEHDLLNALLNPERGSATKRAS